LALPERRVGEQHQLKDRPREFGRGLVYGRIGREAIDPKFLTVPAEAGPRPQSVDHRQRRGACSDGGRWHAADLMPIAGQLDAARMVAHRFAVEQIVEAYDIFASPAETNALEVVLTR
jgi:hypothetical protein